jgi:hypothetical protein
MFLANSVIVRSVVKMSVCWMRCTQRSLSRFARYTRGASSCAEWPATSSNIFFSGNRSRAGVVAFGSYLRLLFFMPVYFTAPAPSPSLPLIQGYNLPQRGVVLPEPMERPQHRLVCEACNMISTLHLINCFVERVVSGASTLGSSAVSYIIARVVP